MVNNIICLVVEPSPLKNMSQLGWNESPSWMERHKIPWFQTTNQINVVKTSSNICHKPPHITSCLMVYTTYKNGDFGDGVFFIAFTSLILKIIEQSSLCYLPLLRHNLFINPPLLKPVPDAPPTNVLVTQSGWWYTYLFEKYESPVGMVIPNWMESHKSHVPNHQPVNHMPFHPKFLGGNDATTYHVPTSVWSSKHG